MFPFDTVARTHISGSFIQPVDVEVAYQRWPRSTLFQPRPRLETPCEGAPGRREDVAHYAARSSFIVHYRNERPEPLCVVAFRISDQLMSTHGKQGRVTRNWKINKRRRDVSRLLARRGSLGLGILGRGGRHIIGTEFERMRDTCINFTGRLVKLVPLRF